MSPIDLTLSYKRKLLKALKHLEYSFKIVSQLNTKIDDSDEKLLADWEAFISRFSRVVDIFLTKYLHIVVQKNDPGFEGSLRDFVDQAEKLKLIQNADRWMELRGFRNSAAHEYEEEDLEKFFESVRIATPEVLAISKTLT